MVTFPIVEASKQNNKYNLLDELKNTNLRKKIVAHPFTQLNLTLTLSVRGTSDSSVLRSSVKEIRKLMYLQLFPRGKGIYSNNIKM